MFRPELIEAIKDYRYLLDKNYPPASTIKLVGDKYALGGSERSILYRGVSSSKSAYERSEKKIHSLCSGHVYIDAYNILFTLANYLLGRPVFISDDGFLRDTGEFHGRFSNTRILDHTFSLLTSFMLENNTNEFILYLDRPVSNSGKLSLRFNNFFLENKIKGNSSTVFSPDHQLIEKDCGIICTSDSVIILDCKVKVYDLSEKILIQNFHPLFDSVHSVFYPA